VRNRRVRPPLWGSKVAGRLVGQTSNWSIRFPGRPAEAEDEGVGTAIVVTLLVLLAVGIVVDQLLRLRKWLKRPPPSLHP
jgi:hypothetical protein